MLLFAFLINDDRSAEPLFGVVIKIPTVKFDTGFALSGGSKFDFPDTACITGQFIYFNLKLSTTLRPTFSERFT